MNKLLKTFNKEQADELKSLGFKYIKDTINGQTVYGFFITKELSDYLNSHFDNKNFFLDNVLRF